MARARLPLNGAAGTGTTVAQTQAGTGPAGINFPFSMQAVVSGLTAGTAYWVDLALGTNTGTSSVGNLGASIVEL